MLGEGDGRWKEKERALNASFTPSLRVWNSEVAVSAPASILLRLSAFFLECLSRGLWKGLTALLVNLLCPSASLQKNDLDIY